MLCRNKWILSHLFDHPLWRRVSQHEDGFSWPVQRERVCQHCNVSFWLVGREGRWLPTLPRASKVAVLRPLEHVQPSAASNQPTVGARWLDSSPELRRLSEGISVLTSCTPASTFSGRETQNLRLGNLARDSNPGIFSFNYADWRAVPYLLYPLDLRVRHTVEVLASINPLGTQLTQLTHLRKKNHASYWSHVGSQPQPVGSHCLSSHGSSILKLVGHRAGTPMTLRLWSSQSSARKRAEQFRSEDVFGR